MTVKCCFGVLSGVLKRVWLSACLRRVVSLDVFVMTISEKKASIRISFHLDLKHHVMSTQMMMVYRNTVMKHFAWNGFK